MGDRVSTALVRYRGLATRALLRSMGCTEHDVRRSIASGFVHSVRRSWLATTHADPEAVRAVELGGVLSGESALRSMGIWVSQRTGLCVAAPRTASRLPALRQGEYRVFPSSFRWPTGMPWRTDAVTSLVVLAKRVQPFDLIASIDSAVHGGHLTVQGLDELFSRLPRSIGRFRSLVNGKSESGIESILRVAAIQRGWRVQVQVLIDGLGRVDLLIDGWLIVEADGDEFHASRAQRERDRVRDAAAVRCGMRTHRFGYAQVMGDLDGCLDVIADLLAAGPPSRSSWLRPPTGSRMRPATGSLSYRPAVSG